MAEEGSRDPASTVTAGRNLLKIMGEGKFKPAAALDTTEALRKELREKVHKGFRRGGKVKKTGLAKVHRGERVLTAKTAKKVTPAKLRAAVRKPAQTRKR